MHHLLKKKLKTTLQSLMGTLLIEVEHALKCFFLVSTEPEASALPSSSYKKKYVREWTELNTLYTTLSVILCILMVAAVAVFLKGRKRNKEKNTSK